MFFLRRTMKILPAYWTFLSIALIFFLTRGREISWLDFLVHYAGIHSFFPKFLYGVSTPLWFVGIIIQLYLLFPILNWTYKKMHPILFWLIVVFSHILLEPFLLKAFGGGRFFTEFIIEFCIGIQIGHLILNKKIWLENKKFILFLIPGFVGLFLLLNKEIFKLSTYQMKFAFLLAGTGLFIGLFSLGENFKLKWVAKLSQIVYPLYLIHYFVLTEVILKTPRFFFWGEAAVFLSMSLIAAYLLKTIPLKIDKYLSAFFGRKKQAN